MKEQSWNSGLLSPSPAPFLSPSLLWNTAKLPVLVLSEKKHSYSKRCIHSSLDLAKLDGQIVQEEVLVPFTMREVSRNKTYPFSSSRVTAENGWAILDIRVFRCTGILQRWWNGKKTFLGNTSVYNIRNPGHWPHEKQLKPLLTLANSKAQRLGQQRGLQGIVLHPCKVKAWRQQAISWMLHLEV